MRYGYFDNEAREYVITRPDTPAPWINYLGNGGYSAIISNCAGGLSFHKDACYRRITRYRFSGVPMDRPGKYIYIRDMDSGEYWSPSWQPAGKSLDEYECRHGMGYTKIKGAYSGISAEVTYFIPLGRDYELWVMKISNHSGRKRNLKVFSYVEFSWHEALRDTICDWPRRLFDCRFIDGFVSFDPMREGEPLFSYFGTDLPIESYDSCRDRFLGAYRTETNPIAVEKGFCSNSSIVSDNACGGLCCPLTLEAGEEKTAAFVLGVSGTRESSGEKGRAALDRKAMERDFEELRQSWERLLSHMRFDTPDEDVNTMLNVWHQYQCKTTFDWSRFISYYERGVDRGIGFRDTMQDVLGAMHMVAPEKIKERINLLLGIQLQRGDAMSVYYPATGKAHGGGRSDDHLWSVYSVCSYIRETGDAAYLQEKIPYYDGGEGAVLEHLENAVRFTMNNLGSNGIPLLLNCDWNDTIPSINKRGGAESVFVFFQLAHAVSELTTLYRQFGVADKIAWAESVRDYCKSKLDTVWDGDWFLRAFTDKGEKYGSHEDEYNKIVLNPQSWAVISGLCPKEKCLTALDSVRRLLNTELGVMSIWPATSEFNPDKKLYCWNPKGTGENGGIFNHTNTWIVIAEAMMGRNEYAWEYYRKVLPSKRNDIADQCMAEPYVYGSSMNSIQHEFPRIAGNSWLTGTASWMFVAVSQYILGIRPDYDGLIVDPHIPAEWGHAEVEREFRGVKFRISIRNNDRGNGTRFLIVDGERIDGSRFFLSSIAGRKTVDVMSEG